MEPLYKLLTNQIHDGLHEQFKQVTAKKNFKQGTVDAGREYIEAYVNFIHYVERLYEAAKKVAHGHYAEADEGEAHKH